jgi:hypothetical protein
MFDFIKIQVQVLKDMVNDKKSTQMSYYEDNDNIYIAYATIAYRIPKTWCYLKLSSLKNTSYLQKLFTFDSSKEWSFKNTLEKYSDIGNKYAYRFTSDNNEMFIDKKLFDSINWKPGDNIKFYAENELSVMKIVQDDIVKAVIMPVKMKR